VFDTGEWEQVYNIRVAAYHTYFVGSEEWGWVGWAHNACIEFQQIPITSSEDPFIASAFTYRDTNKKRVDFTTQTKWLNGGGNSAKIVYTNSSGLPAVTNFYGSNSSHHAEINIMNAFLDGRINSGNPNFVVKEIYTERSMCDECQNDFRKLLLQSQVPSSGVIIVHYLTPYLAGSAGNAALIQAYAGFNKYFTS
jgi:hypothetical protein